MPAARRDSCTRERFCNNPPSDEFAEPCWFRDEYGFSVLERMFSPTSPDQCSDGGPVPVFPQINVRRRYQIFRVVQNKSFISPDHCTIHFRCVSCLPRGRPYASRRARSLPPMNLRPLAGINACLFKRRKTAVVQCNVGGDNVLGVSVNPGDCFNPSPRTGGDYGYVG